MRRVLDFHTAVDDNNDDVRDVYFEHARPVQKGKQIVAKALGVRRVGRRAFRRVGAFRRAVVGALLLRRRLRELEGGDHFNAVGPRGASTASRERESS